MKNTTQILKEKNGIRLVECVNSFGRLSYQINSPETEQFAATVFYDGSDKVIAKSVFKDETEQKGKQTPARS